MKYPQKFLHVTHHRYNRGTSTAVYLPVGVETEGTASTGIDVGAAAPYGGRLLRCIARSSVTTAGVTDMTLSVDESDTVSADATQNISAADTPYTFTFTGATFTAGAKLGLKFAPTGIPDDIHVAAVWEYEATDWNGG